MRVLFIVLFIMVPGQLTGMSPPWFFHARYFLVEPIYQFKPDLEPMNRRSRRTRLKNF